LIANQDEKFEPELFGFGHEVVRLAPIINPVSDLDFAPHDFAADGVDVHLLELEQIVIKLLERLIGAHGRVPDLIGDSSRNKVFLLERIPEIALANFQTTAAPTSASNPRQPTEETGHRRLAGL